MRRHWDRFARRDPMYYVAAHRGLTPERFFESGRQTAEQILGWLGACPGASPGAACGRMLDLGCGLGRTAVAFARHFDHVDAVDISPEMIRRARALDPPANVRFEVSNGTDLRVFDDGQYDLVLSMLVFQHIPDDRVVASYLAEIARVLRPDGRAVLQFDTRPPGVLSRVYEHLPTLLTGGPRGTHGRYIRRYRRSPDRLTRMVAAAGLAVHEQRGPGTANHLLLVKEVRAS